MNIKTANIVIEDKYIPYLKNKKMDFVNIVSDISKDNNLPTLIIGWANAKNYKEDISILNKTIESGLYWTFSPDEKKMFFDDDVSQFTSLSVDDFTSHVKYLSIDPVIKKIKNVNDFEKYYLKSEGVDSVYIDDTYIYFYVHESDTIYGIDTKYYSSIGYSKDVLIEHFKSVANKVLIEDYTTDGSVILKFKEYFGKDIIKKYIAYFNHFDV